MKPFLTFACIYALSASMLIVPMWGASASGPYATPNTPAYGGVIYTATSQGKTLVWVTHGKWVYHGHQAYTWSLTVNGVTTYHASGTPTFKQ